MPKTPPAKPAAKTPPAKPTAPVKPAPAKPAALAAPPKKLAAPQKPETGVNAGPMKPIAPAKPTAPTAPANAGAGAAILAEIAKLTGLVASMKAEIEHLKAAKAKAAKLTGGRTKAEIIDGVTVATGDWRADYQGAEIMIRSYERKGGAIVIDDTAAPLPVVLAMPRDADKGGQRARSLGMLAVHWEKGEDGTYSNAPEYVDAPELAQIWAD